MQINIITLFPKMFRACPVSRSSAKRMQAEGRLYGGPFAESIVARAIEEKKLTLNIHNLRDWAIDERGTVDDRPYGGGTGMLLRLEPIFSAVEAVKTPGVLPASPCLAGRRAAGGRSKSPGVKKKHKVILLDAGGKLYTQQTAQKLSKLEHIILICGHYEGVDYRVHQHLADETISIGDYVLTGGEIPAMVIVDSVTRLLPGVLQKEDATKLESFSLEPRTSPARRSPRLAEAFGEAQVGAGGNLERPLLEYPQYTRPEEYKGHKVPQVLLSGNHAEIEKWRMKKAKERTGKNRPDLLL